MGNGGRYPRKLFISPEELIDLYSVQLMPTSQIAERFGVARQTIFRRVVSLGINTHRKTVQAICPNCKEPFTYWKSARRGVSRHCSRRCYFEATSLFGKYSRQGQRMGRKVSGAVAGEVVHHIDGDCHNNEPGNLVVFDSQRQHMSFHKSGAAKWLKEKVEKKEVVLTEVTRWPK